MLWSEAVADPLAEPFSSPKDTLRWRPLRSADEAPLPPAMEELEGSCTLGATPAMVSSSGLSGKTSPA